MSAAEERARIVRWLRAQAEHYPEDLFPPDGESRGAIAGHALRRFSASWAARIEEGEHHEERGT